MHASNRESAPVAPVIKPQPQPTPAAVSFLDLADLMSSRADADRQLAVKEARSDAWRLEKKGKPGRNAHRKYTSMRWTGNEALEEITGIERPARAAAWYQRFLAEHRAGAPPDGVLRSDWEAIANAWAGREVEMVQLGGLPGTIVLVDKMQFTLWRGGYLKHLDRIEPTGVPKLITSTLPRGFVPRPGKAKSKAPKGSPAPRALWNKTEATPIKWSEHEKAAGIPKAIAASNFAESFHIPADLARQREKDHWDQRAMLKQHNPEKPSREHWQKSGVSKQEAADMQAKEIEEKHAQEEEEAREEHEQAGGDSEA
jgi:hypothetical protein